MPKPPGSRDPYKWTLDLPPGSQCSVGWSRNENVDQEGKSKVGRPNEDRYYTCTYQDKLQLYMVLDGHDGTRACDFVQKHLPHSVLRSDLERGDVSKELIMAFRSTEREFFIGIDPHITRRLTLVIEIQQKAENSHQASMLCPQQVDEIDHLDNQIKGGTTVVLALIFNNTLYVANVGDSRALLCSYNPTYGDQLIVEQLSKDHNTSNDEELRRLAECGLDPSELRRARRLGYQQNTRSIGDYSIKGGFSDVDSICKAHREPGTAEPHISRPINLVQFRGFLVLMSDGLYEAYEAWTHRPLMVNEDIAHLVAQEMKKTSDISVVAQNVVENVKSLFCTSCRDGRRPGRLDDITLIVRNLGYPTPIPHTHSYPGRLSSISQTPSNAPMGGGNQHILQDPQQARVLQPSMSYPSHMHNQQQPNQPPMPMASNAHTGVHPLPQYGMAGGPYYPPAGTMTGDPGRYNVTQPPMSLGSGAVGGNVGPNDTVFYSMGPGVSRNNYSGFQGADPQNRHPPQAGIHHNQGYNHGSGFYYQGGIGGGYPSNYQQSTEHQHIGGGSVPGQHPRPHTSVAYTVSDPHERIPPHPAYSQRSGSLQDSNVITSPEHSSRQQVKHEYENIPNRSLNTIAESDPQSSSPMKHSSTVYENVTLRQQQTLHPGGSGEVQTNRYSDSLLAEKTREMSLEGQSAGGVASDVPPVPVRPHSAEPPRQAANDNFTSIVSALPSLQTEPVDIDDENFMLYGWKADGGGGDSSSISTLTPQGTLSSSEIPSLQEEGGASHTSSMTQANNSIEAKTPVNGEIHQLGSISKDPSTPPAQSQSAESAKQDEEEGEYEDFVISDFSEASEAEDDEEIDAESGEIRSYIKNWGRFPFDRSWEEV